MNIRQSTITLCIAIACFFNSSIQASDLVKKWSIEQPSQEERRTPQGLYINAENAYKWLQEDDSVILVDVRTPEEWQFVGYSPLAKIMIPSVSFDYSKFNSEKKRYASRVNNDFVAQFEDKIYDLGADEKTHYIIMCRSGATRAQPAAKMLAQYGFKNVWIMIDGFEGGKVKQGEKKGWRNIAGWKTVNPASSWTYDLAEEQAYLMK